MSRDESRQVREVIDELRNHDELQRKYGGKAEGDVEWIAYKFGVPYEKARSLVARARHRMAEEDNER